MQHFTKSMIFFSPQNSVLLCNIHTIKFHCRFTLGIDETSVALVSSSKASLWQLCFCKATDR